MSVPDLLIVMVSLDTGQNFEIKTKMPKREILREINGKDEKGSANGLDDQWVTIIGTKDSGETVDVRFLRHRLTAFFITGFEIKMIQPAQIVPKLVQ